MPGYGTPAPTTNTDAPTAGQLLLPADRRASHTVRPVRAAKTVTRPSYVGTRIASRATVAQPNGAARSGRRQTVFPVAASSAYSTPFASAGDRANAFGVVTALSREQSSTTGT